MNRFVLLSPSRQSLLPTTTSRFVVRHNNKHGNSYFRTFFGWNGNSGDNKGGDGDKSNGKDAKRMTEESREEERETSSTGSTNFVPTRPLSTGGVSGGVFVPSRLGVGDDSPRYPHLVGLPVITRPMFPGITTPITLTDKTTINALEKMTSDGAGYVGVFLRKDGKSEGGLIIDKPEVITDPDQLYEVGTFAQISRINPIDTPSNNTTSPYSAGGQMPNGDDSSDKEEEGGHDAASVVLYAHRRIDLVSVDKVESPIDLTVRHWDPLQYNPDGDSKLEETMRALTNEVISTIRDVASMNPMFRELLLQFYTSRVDASDPYRLADFVASVSTGSPEELQAILAEKDAELRLHKSLLLISKEREVSKLQAEISKNVEEKMSEQQRKYFLNEQLKSIKKELGMEQDDKEALIEKYRAKLKEYTEIPEEAMKTIESELEKLSTLERNSSEFNVTRSYLDWLTDIPWGVLSDEAFDIEAARTVLDRDHYGLDDVKDIILQFIAVGKLKGTVQGKILCLAGPPGTGKTSIASSVADALGRKFYRFSVGGLSDVSEIKGHRRTYIGAMPGKLIQCLKSTGTNNPLILIDEIDKLGQNYRGDPSSALLEVLDPSQNSSFRDHFLDVPVDMSKVLFMCTANDIERIPGPLLDRMEVIRLSGYDMPEKVAIAEQYLVPKTMRESGLMVEKNVEEVEVVGEEDSTEEDKKPEYVLAEGIPDTIGIDNVAIENLVRWYCREAGVRNLSKHIEKIFRKLALQVVAERDGTELTEKSKRKSDTWKVTGSNLDEYVGKPIFTSDRMYETDPLPHGIVMGLAWTSMGGSALYIETQAIKRGNDADGKPRGGGMLKVTGQLGDVMSESTQIAYTVVRARLSDVQSENTFFDDSDIHMHVPEGATPKDGPSAGVTMTTAMLSLALDRPVRSDLAMTGEISLTGKVLPVGGIKEKTMAARRAGIKVIVLPIANKRDFDELPDYLKDGLEAHFADDYQTVYDVAFGTSGDSTGQK